jgi:hypothetical protein
MELQEFIERSIKEITTALHNSSKDMIKSKTGQGIPDHNEINVSFDIAVTAGDTASQEGSAKIRVLNAFNLGGGAKTATDKQEVSRLSFIVPVRIKTIDSPQYSTGG